MIKLIDPKGEEIKEPLDINKDVNNFYSNLYKAKDLEECEITLLTGNGNSETIWGGIKIIRRENNNRRGRNSVEKYEALVWMVLGQNFSSAFGSSLDHL